MHELDADSVGTRAKGCLWVLCAQHDRRGAIWRGEAELFPFGDCAMLHELGASSMGAPGKLRLAARALDSTDQILGSDTRRCTLVIRKFC